MTTRDILYIVYLCLAFLVGAIPAVISFVRAAKAKHKATTAEEKDAQYKEMLDQANKLIESAEVFYDAFDKVLKTQNESAGPYKKESVMTKLQAYALKAGITFDSNYWSEKIDEIVALTKKVNSK